jgi:2'-5' RNA ligase
VGIRSFIAIEIPEDIQDAMGRIQERLRSADVNVRWTQPHSIHLTVKFLGDVPDADIPKVCEVMKSVSSLRRPFELTACGLGSFPAKGAPRIIWVGFSGELDALAKLVDDMERGIADGLGIPPENRAFHPHLTLGRVKSSRDAERLRKLMDQCDPAELGTFTAEGVTLFMSKLSRDGSIYTPMAETRFEG